MTMARQATRADPRTGVIAGSGSLPIDIVRTLRARGESPFLVLVEGEADPGEPVFAGCERVILATEQVGDLIVHLKRAGVDRAVLAGGVARRPVFSRIRWNMGTLRMLPRIFVALARGDDVLLRALIGHIEAHGIAVVGAHEIVPDLLAPAGVLSAARPTRADQADIDAGLAAARAIGALDIGQAAIAIGGRAIALEGIEGTDGLLERTKALRGHGRLAGRTRGVLVKCAKPGQELRADLPSIGPRTMDDAHAAGLAGVAVEAGSSFILSFGETVARADALGLFLVGFDKGAGR